MTKLPTPRDKPVREACRRVWQLEVTRTGGCSAYALGSMKLGAREGGHAAERIRSQRARGRGAWSKVQEATELAGARAGSHSTERVPIAEWPEVSPDIR